MEQTEFYYKGNNFTYKWDPKEELGFLEVWGTHTKKDAEEFKENVVGFLDNFKNTYALTLIECSKIVSANHEARRIYTKVSKDIPGNQRVAIIGAKPLIKILLGFLIVASKRENFKFFDDKEKAVKWLKSK